MSRLSFQAFSYKLGKHEASYSKILIIELVDLCSSMSRTFCYLLVWPADMASLSPDYYGEP